MTDETERTKQIAGSISLEKKPRVSKKDKEAILELKREIEAIKNDISKLHLMLWHTGYKGDYHSLTLDEARERLSQIRKNIDDILNMHL
jgi:hypothetical protein